MKKSQPKFRFLSEHTLRNTGEIEIKKHLSATLRPQLKKGIYWLQPVPRGAITWNVELLKSYLIHGGDSPEHLALLAEYVSSIPKAG